MISNIKFLSNIIKLLHQSAMIFSYLRNYNKLQISQEVLFFQDQSNTTEVSSNLILDRKNPRGQTIHSKLRSYDIREKNVNPQGIKFHPIYLGQMTHMKILDEDLHR